jgi:adenosine deaminase
MSNIDPQLPLIDLHRHLDGSIRLETVLELGEKYGLPLPAHDLEGMRPYVQVTVPQPGVMAFIEKFHWLTRVLVDLEACRLVSYRNLETARDEGLDYVELRFSPWFMAEAHGLDPAGVVEAVCDGVEAGVRDYGIPAKLIGILSRTYGPEIGMRELQALLTQKDRIAALDLAGDEANVPAELFHEHFRLAKQAGWHLTAHAGESAGPESIWRAINDLGAERIGHGVAALRDPQLLDSLRQRRIGIECNLTSNVQTSTVSSYAVHPLKRFLELDLLATINSDDPGISGIDLRFEYEQAAPQAGLSQEQIRQAQRNALETAFLTEEEKEGLMRRKAGTSAPAPPG